jgi:hypothetical protein
MPKFIPTPKTIDLRIAPDYTTNLAKLRVIYGSDKEIRKEYRRLQAAVDKRLKRMEAAGLGESVQARQLRQIPRISKLETMQKVAVKLNKAYQNLASPKYTLPGVRRSSEKRAETLVEKRRVLEGAVGSELDTLFRVVRRRGFLGVYGSDRVLQLYKSRQEAGKETNYTEQQWQGVVSALQRKITAVDITATAAGV